MDYDRLCNYFIKLKMGGYSNFYLGNGHKSSQPAWSTLINENLQNEAVEGKEFPEPNPKVQSPAEVPANK